MSWLRARMHLLAPVALGLALVALALDWAFGAHTPQETLVYAALGLGGLGLLALKLAAMKRDRDD